MYPCMRTVRATFLHALHVEITPKPVTQVTWYLQACTGSLVGVCCSAFGLQITLARELRSAAGHLSSFGKSWLTYLVTQFVVIQIDCSAVRVCFPVLRLFPAVVSNTERTKQFSPLGTPSLTPKPSAFPGQLAAERDVCADFMPTLEINKDVITTGATLQASAYCSRPDSLLCANRSVMLL